MTEERLVELRENHGPWHYTEFGVLCSCGEAMDANEECPTLQLVSEIDRLHAELAAVKAEKKSLEVESLCAYIDLLKAENERYRLALGRISCSDTGPSDVATAPACCVAYVALAPELAP